MLQTTGKRAAASPLSSEFEKRPKLELKVQELEKLNKTLNEYTMHSTWRSPEEVLTSYLTLAFREVASVIDSSWDNKDRCNEYVRRLSSEEQLELASVWINARDTQDWNSFATYLLPQIQSPTTQNLIGNLLPLVSTGQSESATLGSWDIDYVGDADDLLYEHLATYSKQDSRFARYTSIVQSSGMGKSRTIDELSKKHLVAPLNLREESNGFPPPDANVRDWLLKSKTKMEASSRASAFLYALFVTLLRYLEAIDSKISLPAAFRGLMTAGQGFSHQGPTRKEFYDDVVTLAQQVLVPPSPSAPQGREAKYDTKEAVHKLMEFLLPGFNVLNDYPPALIISFDEAHQLALIEDGPWSRFSELRAALQNIHVYPCFSVFLSTTGKVNQFMPKAKHDVSNRYQLGVLVLVPPFCELGFDQLAAGVNDETTLDTVASLEFIATLSRPLFAGRYIMGDEGVKKSIIIFAGEKLLCKPFPSSDEFIRKLSDEEKMACISVRMPLEFSAKTLRSQEMERTLVERHLRVCLSVDPGFDSAITIAPSEPLLSEASYLVMKSPAFDFPQILLSELEHSGLDKGNRGELVAMVLCLMARDAAAERLNSRVIPVCDFIPELLTSSAQVLRSKPTRARNLNEADKTFEDTFSKSKIFFNHFIKLRDHGVINRKFLMFLISRGAAGLCADYQYGIDIVIPFLFWDRRLRRENVSAIILQCKNNIEFQAKPCHWLFDMMNPYNIRFFEEKEIKPVPIIRMVFALASTDSAVVPLQSGRVQPSRGAAPKLKFQGDAYTAFDIWCAKASCKTFVPIKNDFVFNEILLRSSLFPDIYNRKKSERLRNATRSMNPASAVHQAHWRFAKSTSNLKLARDST